MNVGVKKRAEEAVVALGKDCSFAQALAWLNQKYGKTHGVTDSKFYVARKDYRTKLAKSNPPVAKPVIKPTPVLDRAVVDDLLKRAANLPGVVKPTDAAVDAAARSAGAVALDAALAKEAANREPISIVEPSTSLNEWQTLEQKEVTISELRKVAEFCKGIGGVSRARHLLRELESLTV